VPRFEKTYPVNRPMSTRNRSTRIRRRRFALTLNNPTVGECLKWNNVVLFGSEAEHASDLRFFVVQTEKGDGTDGTPLGTVHYQGYCEFGKAVEWSVVKAIFGDRVHLENARAGSAANIRYCTKVATRFTGGPLCVAGQWGTAKRGGGPAQVAVKIQNGATIDEIDLEFPDMVLMNGPRIEAYIARQKGLRSEKPKVTILYGLTGCGKSRYCVETFGTKPGDVYWVSPPDGGKVWFGGYMCQKVVIFDDFHDHWFPLTKLLRILDSTPLMVAPKGSQIYFNSPELVFTSNVDPRDWYTKYLENNGKKAHKDALERRIQDFAEIVDCTVEHVMVPHCDELVAIRRRAKRTEEFKFRENLGLDFSIEIPGGNGDMTSGNGFGRRAYEY